MNPLKRRKGRLLHFSEVGKHCIQRQYSAKEINKRNLKEPLVVRWYQTHCPSRPWAEVLYQNQHILVLNEQI